MDLIFVGQPTFVGVTVNGKYLAESQETSSDAKTFRLLHREDAWIGEGIQISFNNSSSDHEEEPEDSFFVHPPLGSRRRRAKKRGWARLRVVTIATTSKHSLGAYLIYNQDGSGSTIILYEQPNATCYLGNLPDETSIADLSLPGTHDTCAFYGVPISQCQQPATPLSQQLLDGIRFLDIRCRVINGELIIYHGARSQRNTFVAVLAELRSFLESYPTETVIMSIKDEKRHEDFSRLVWLDMEKYRDLWFLENRVPTLGEVRGKAIIMGRFWTSPNDDSWDNGLGWRIPGWGPPVKNLAFDCGGTSGMLQDWYDLPSFLDIPEKLAITTNLLQNPRQSDQAPILTISYASASGYPLAPPFIIAKGFGWPQWGFGIEGINSRLEGWLIRQLRDGKRIKGIVPLDFYRQTGSDDGGGVCELLVLMNML